MDLKNVIENFNLLGNRIKQVLTGNCSTESETKLAELISSIHLHNAWFTQGNVRLALNEISTALEKNNLENWLSDYTIAYPNKPNRIGVITAGNIPLVGFHDFLSVLVTGNIFVGKLSSDDNLLLTAVAAILFEINPEFKQRILFLQGLVKDIDAVIATGSNNSARYFEHYFGKYPHIIRKNRNSIAILTGEESSEELKNLSDDIFTYFGLGCRNVSKLFVPEGYDMVLLLNEFERYKDIINHNKYGNNYDYNKAIYLVNRQAHLDTGFALFKEDKVFVSPVGVVFYEFYKSIGDLNTFILENRNQLQCIVCKNELGISNAVNFGQAQKPLLSDYADGVDTVDFLLSLNS